jgi:hypothetical protein
MVIAGYNITEYDAGYKIVHPLFFLLFSIHGMVHNPEFQRKLYFPLSDEIFRKCAVSTIWSQGSWQQRKPFFETKLE